MTLRGNNSSPENGRQPGRRAGGKDRWSARADAGDRAPAKRLLTQWQNPRPPVNVAVLGLGYWGPNLLRVLADMESATVRWICDLDENRLKRFWRRHPEATPTTDFQAILDDPEVDAVLIATPMQTHYQFARMSLEAGKHTFVEKPLASSADEVDALIELADRMDLVLMPGFTFLYSPPVRAIKALLQRGELGELYFISSSRVNLTPFRKDISVIADLGPHDFSMLMYWTEEMPLSIRANGRDAVIGGIPDVAFITLTFPSGLIANVELSWIAPSKLRRTVLAGSRKMVVYDDVAQEQVKVYDNGFDYRTPESFGEHQLTTRTGDISIPNLGSDEPLCVEMEEFVDAVRAGSGRRERLLLARDVVRLTEAADISLKKHAERLLLDDRMRPVASAVTR